MNLFSVKDKMYKRPVYNTLLQRLQEPKRGHIQVLAGPRQVGKTTLSQQLIASQAFKVHYASADAQGSQGSVWIEQQWDIARLFARTHPGQQIVLILDEIQKVPHWSEITKKMWDKDTADAVNIKVVLLGSAALLIQQGLSESLAGRVELLPVTHWSFNECAAAFGWSVEQYIYFGGYPGAAGYISEEERWTRYILDSLVDTTISRDILQMVSVHKPALLRQVFELGCHYSSQILSYQKMLGQLRDAGNATTIKHYLELLSKAGMLTGLEKFTIKPIQQKASSPKLQALNTALISANAGHSFASAQADREHWGRLTESAIGAHLINWTQGTSIQTFYWREANKEVDFVLRKGMSIIAIEVKSGTRPTALPGMADFAQRFQPQSKLLVGSGGIPIEEFLRINPTELFSN